MLFLMNNSIFDEVVKCDIPLTFSEIKGGQSSLHITICRYVFWGQIATAPIGGENKCVLRTNLKVEGEITEQIQLR